MIPLVPRQVKRQLVPLVLDVSYRWYYTDDMSKHEFLARQAKVARLVAFLEEHGRGLALAETIGMMSADSKAEIVRMAGEQRPASKTTWRMVESELRHRERVAAHKAERMVAA